MTTDTGERTARDLMLSTWTGGEVPGGQTAGGAMWYLVEEVPNEVTYMVELPHEPAYAEGLDETKRYTFDLQKAKQGEVTKDTLEVAWRHENFKKME